ncbi:MAG TPA: hypothetical protein VHO29_20565 [Marmoricola sp.]|nr:hypothetical protein [Marmoricola sp.]
MSARIDYCGEITRLEPHGTVTIGREGDVEIDDNPYLHRRFLEVAHIDDLVWLSNVGSAISATLADEEGLVQSWLSPGARVPLVFPTTIVWFTAGPTTYELEIILNDAPFVPAAVPEARDGSTTLGRVTFTPDQRLLVLALAEPILRRGNRGAGSVPPSAAAAERLGWTITKFNRKLDNVCEKLTKLGVRGLVGQGRAASNRRARLVEYALAARLITTADLAWLDALGPVRR